MRRDDFQLPIPPRLERPGHPYACGRSPGCDPCLHGPSREGTCPFADSADPDNEACSPRRTWAGRRRQFTAAMLAILAAAMVVLFATRATPKVIQPGNLTTAHAQILSGELAQDRCAACHQNATSNRWLATSSDPSSSKQNDDKGLFDFASWIGGGGTQHAGNDRFVPELPRATNATRVSSMGTQLVARSPQRTDIGSDPETRRQADCIGIRQQ